MLNRAWLTLTPRFNARHLGPTPTHMRETTRTSLPGWSFDTNRGRTPKRMHALGLSWRLIIDSPSLLFTYLLILLLRCFIYNYASDDQGRVHKELHSNETPRCHYTTVGCRAKVLQPPRFCQTSLITIGLTGDPIGRFIKKTALNPAFTLVFILLARYTKKGSDLSILHETAFSRIKTLFYFGLARWVSNYFDVKVLDNWTSDTYDWDKEIVLITGGAGGIGGNVVKLLAEKGTKIVVLDVIPMAFEARMLSPLRILQAPC
jgi:hypothetical protein